jgi:hypothetical protein
MKRTLSILLVLALLLAGLTALAGCSGDGYDDEYTEETYEETEAAVGESEEDSEETRVPVGSYGASARGHLEAITAIGARWSGSEEEAETAEYIREAFAEIGYEADVQPFTALGEDDGEEIQSANVVTVKEGDSQQQIVVGAHYDSSDESLGADDNASGVAVLLEAAELVADESTPYTIVFIAFGGEEAGILGSTAYVGEMDADEIENTILFINMDSIVAGDIAYVYGDSADGDTARDWILDWAGSNGYEMETVEDANLSQEGEATADYAPFLEAGIPWIYFEATNWTLGNEDGYTQVDPQYGKEGAIIHTEYDTLDYLDETFPGRVDAHLDLYIAILYNLLTAYHLPQ